MSKTLTPFTINFPTDKVENLIFEGIHAADRYWGRFVEEDRDQFDPRNYGEIADDIISGGEFQVYDHTGEGWGDTHNWEEYKGFKMLTFSTNEMSLSRAMNKFASYADGRHFADFIRGDEDSITGDVFLQLLIFDRVLFS